MERTNEEYHALLKETADFYSEDTLRRSLTSNGNCAYSGEGDTKCAFSRCMTNSLNAAEGENVFQFPDVDKVLRPEYQGYNANFWWKLQRLHDCSAHWDKNGLTEYGKDYVNNIKLDINKGEYHKSLSNITDI